MTIKIKLINTHTPRSALMGGARLFWGGKEEKRVQFCGICQKIAGFSPKLWVTMPPNPPLGFHRFWRFSPETGASFGQNSLGVPAGSSSQRVFPHLLEKGAKPHFVPHFPPFFPHFPPPSSPISPPFFPHFPPPPPFPPPFPPISFSCLSFPHKTTVPSPGGGGECSAPLPPPPRPLNELSPELEAN